MNIPVVIDAVLWPVKWLIEAILVGAHTVLTSIGFGGGDGVTWVLAILGLVVIVRAALIPLFVRQIRSQRRMTQIAPQLKAIQARYKGKRDQPSREAMSRETAQLYKAEGVNPLGSCFPLLVQIPIFFGLFSVLNGAQRGTTAAGVGLLNRALSHSFGSATLFGAPLRDSISTAHLAGSASGLVLVIAVAMIVLMSASQFITQLQIMSKNVSPETKASPLYRQQRVLLFVLPLVFIYSGITFPLGVMFYWLFSNLWTMTQQYFVIRAMPTPGSEAALQRDRRLARRARRSPRGNDPAEA